MKCFLLRRCPRTSGNIVIFFLLMCSRQIFFSARIRQIFVSLYSQIQESNQMSGVHFFYWSLFFIVFAFLEQCPVTSSTQLDTASVDDDEEESNCLWYVTALSFCFLYLHLTIIIIIMIISTIHTKTQHILQRLLFAKSALQSFQAWKLPFANAEIFQYVTNHY